MKSPVEQFTIKTIIPIDVFGYDVSFTNASLFMILSVLFSSLFLYMGIKKSSLIKLPPKPKDKEKERR